MGAPCFLEENLTAEYPNCCPRIECPPAAAVEEVPNEINEIEDDQIMMGGQEYPVMVSYDASLDQVRFHLGVNGSYGGRRGSIWN